MSERVDEAIRTAAVFDYSQHRLQAWEKLDRILTQAARAYSRKRLARSERAKWERYERFKKQISELLLDCDDYADAIRQLTEALHV